METIENYWKERVWKQKFSKQSAFILENATIYVCQLNSKHNMRIFSQSNLFAGWTFWLSKCFKLSREVDQNLNELTLKNNYFLAVSTIYFIEEFFSYSSHDKKNDTTRNNDFKGSWIMVINVFAAFLIKVICVM